MKQLKELTTLKKFIPYFDIPLQHISSPVLKRMGRFYDEKYIQEFLTQITKLFPTRFVRTNLIIGFPGETKSDFEKLQKFVQQADFDNIALFEYHDEKFAASSKLDKKVSAKEIRRRFNAMKKIVDTLLQKKSKARKGEQEVGYIMNVKRLKSGKVEKLTIRPWLHAPEIDSYDTIKRDQVLATFDDDKEANIGDRIVYIV